MELESSVPLIHTLSEDINSTTTAFFENLDFKYFDSSYI